MHMNEITMEKYRLVGERKSGISEEEEEEKVSEESYCEVRITQQGKPRNYISYAMNLFVSISSFHFECFGN